MLVPYMEITRRLQLGVKPLLINPTGTSLHRYPGIQLLPPLAVAQSNPFNRLPDMMNIAVHRMILERIRPELAQIFG